MPLPWVLWASVLAISLLAAYVHLLTSAIDRGEALRRHQAGGLIATANAAIDGALNDAASGLRGAAANDPSTVRSLPPIPHTHHALIVVP
ncbi:MAG: hypothetical protein MZW92_26340 [Comamonadaceae bacterium]|nr:hypothetical protein [Comamonadaceae bacterium]